jgi:adenylosuccinate synthase
MNTVVVGLQWGDEGKGKIVDMLTSEAQVVVRGQGGSNAGHTVIVGDKKYVLHLIPSGILWNEKLNVIGNGVVMDPMSLVGEIEGLEAQGVTIESDRLKISDRAHIVLPLHCELDGAREAALGDRKIGTTKRGIGPTYCDKANRSGLRLADALDPTQLTAIVTARVEEANAVLAPLGLETFTAEGILAKLEPALERLRPYVTDTVPILHEAWKKGEMILFEGAQGTFLDIDFGTYPFVTSSNTTSGGCTTGSGLPPTAIERVIGVCKAYTTRVGAGPFITRNDELETYLHGLGREFGATTGRPRSCGWLDVVLLRFACMVNGVTDLAVTNVDGLDEKDTLQICTGYEIDGTIHEFPPANKESWNRATPIYEDLPGWQSDTTDCRTWDDLPPNARAYLERLGELSGARITFVGIGPKRDQTITKAHP